MGAAAWGGVVNALCPAEQSDAAGWAPMLSFIARNGGVGVSGAWGVRWALLPQLVSTFITTAGTPGLTPTPGRWREQGVPTPGRSPRMRVDRDWAGYCMSATEAAGSRQAKYCT